LLPDRDGIDLFTDFRSLAIRRKERREERGEGQERARRRCAHTKLVR